MRKACRCAKEIKSKDNWKVQVRNGNYSHFESPKGEFHYSDYSQACCLECGATWRTKAAYVSSLDDYDVSGRG